MHRVIEVEASDNQVTCTDMDMYIYSYSGPERTRWKHARELHYIFKADKTYCIYWNSNTKQMIIRAIQMV